MKEWLIEHKFYVAAALIIVMGGYVYFSGNDADPLIQTEAIGIESKLQEEKMETPQNNQDTRMEQPQPDAMMVDVKGQIKLPGVYKANPGERVIDIIDRAGGLTDQADQSQVNLSAHVQDEMVIYIPAMGEEGIVPQGSSVGGTASSSGSGQTQGKININKADAAELQKLPGIGPAKAAAIIEYRQASGPFKVVEDLKKISGIGEKTFDKLKDLVTVH